MPGACSTGSPPTMSTARPDTITYTQWLNERGTLEADLTVSKLDDEHFFVVVTDTMHRHAETWMKRHIGRRAGACHRCDADYCQINVQGPQSRALLQTLTSADLSNDAYPFRTAREIDIAGTRGAVHPHHLRRRARLRALHSGRAGDPRLRPAGRSRHARSGCAMPG